MSNPVGDDVVSVDNSFTTAISADLAIVTALQALIVSATASPKPTYTISGPTGSQTVNWESYVLGLNTQLGDAQKRIMEWFKLKQSNLPYFKVRKGW